MDSYFSQAGSKTQTVSFWFWTRVADSISYDDNHYVKHASIIYIYDN